MDFENENIPEILRTNLANVILLLKRMGYQIISQVEFLDQPKIHSINFSLYELWTLGAINENQNLTKIGAVMSELPIDPRFARAVIEGISLGCLN